MAARAQQTLLGRGEAVISLKPAGQHELRLHRDGRVDRVFDRDQVAELSAVLSRVAPEDARRLIAAFLPGFSVSETDDLIKAVTEFERHAQADAEKEHLRTWPDTIRVTL